MKTILFKVHIRYFVSLIPLVLSLYCFILCQEKLYSVLFFSFLFNNFFLREDHDLFLYDTTHISSFSFLSFFFSFSLSFYLRSTYKLSFVSFFDEGLVIYAANIISLFHTSFFFSSQLLLFNTYI